MKLKQRRTGADLKEYKQKRNLSGTPEPKPGLKHNGTGKYPVFVVHKHAARRLHYDLRLEMQGVLKSFAVPKGPSLDPSVKRLAMMVEDHPFDYRDFEGIIPKGNYGAGSVIIWDRGFYGSPFAKEPEENEKYLVEGLKKGDLKFALAGKKLKGGFALVKTKWQENSWLLIKEKDKYATANDILGKNRSVVSGRTLEEIAGKNPDGSPAQDDPGQNLSVNELVKTAPRSAMPHKISPMLAQSVKKPFNDPGWIFEVKWDGYRAIAEITGKNVLLYSRNRLPLMKKFSPVVSSLKKLGFEAVLDGEVIAVDKQGLPNFQMLQDAGKTGNARLIYYVFDILYYNGRSLTGLPLIKRKELLKEILPSAGNIRPSGYVLKDGVSFFNAAKSKGLEGIVAKYSNSAYLQDSRSEHWLKIKNRVTQDCVIAGFTQPKGSRKYFGSLVLGAYEKGKLVYIGHSGGGFSGMNIRAIYDKLMPLAQKNSPFNIKPEGVELITWVKPELVCEVDFTGWTKEGIMRQPLFLRLRSDKAAQEAIIEKPKEKITGQEGK